MKERLQKVLARGGVGSRRMCEELIAARRVSVNGKITSEPGTQIDPINDDVSVDGTPIERQAAVYYLLHKPRGTVCTARPRHHEKTAVSLVESFGGERLFTVGRLDEDSAGALVVTNDGAFANLLTHPRYGIAKTYRVTVRGKADPELLNQIRLGVRLAEGKTAPASIHVVKRSREWSVLKVTLREGKNRHIRRVFAKVGLPVKEITRIAIGSVVLGRIPIGSWRVLSTEEVAALSKEALAPAPVKKKATKKTTKKTERKPPSS